MGHNPTKAPCRHWWGIHNGGSGCTKRTPRTYSLAQFGKDPFAGRQFHGSSPLFPQQFSALAIVLVAGASVGTIVQGRRAFPRG